MFYKKGIDISNDKQMFEFLKGHFTYPTMDYHNYRYSIANNVKMNRLNLSGDWWVALKLLENGEYDTIEIMIHDWNQEHPGYEVYFNGRSGGYLVLYNKNSRSDHVLPDDIVESDNYDEYKDCCRHYCGSVKANHDNLVFYTKLVQDFDKLCDELRDFCDGLSKIKFEVVEMARAVEDFNDKYYDDLELLGFELLRCEEAGKVDVNEISTLSSLYEAFTRLADRSSSGYSLKSDEDGNIYLTVE